MAYGTTKATETREIDGVRIEFRGEFRATGMEASVEWVGSVSVKIITIRESERSDETGWNLLESTTIDARVSPSEARRVALDILASADSEGIDLDCLEDREKGFVAEVAMAIQEEVERLLS